MSAVIAPENQPRLLGHPIGLYILFFTEMWERFSYYGMRGLLKLYMVNYLFVVHRQVYQGNNEILEAGDPSTTLGWSMLSPLLPETIQGQASVLYGWYTGLVYLTPLFGGILADRVLGQRRAVIAGGVLMALGHFVMAAEDWFFPALLLLILGNGAFKPNVSTQVGGLYPEGDPRRDGAFTIFYMGINLGAFLSNLVCGTLAATLGWHWGFGAAGVGMVAGLVVYLAGGRYLPTDERARRRMEFVSPDAPTVSSEAAHIDVTPRTLGLSRKEWLGVGALVVLCLLNVVFWAVYEQ
jgi:POT family proton-dependent oligopeptide transporter